MQPESELQRQLQKKLNERSPAQLLEMSEEKMADMLCLEQGSFDPFLQASEETLRERLDLKHHMIGSYVDGKLVGMISFSYADVDPEMFSNLPVEAVSFSHLPTPEHYNAALVYNLSVLPESRGKGYAEELVKAAIVKAKQDGCEFIVGEGRIPSFNGSDSEVNGIISRNEIVHSEITQAIQAGHLPNESTFLKDPLLRYYKSIFDKIGLEMHFVRLVPGFTPEDEPSGGMRVLFKVNLQKQEHI